MGEKNKFSSPGAYAGNRRGRKVAGIVGGICATGAALVVLIAFLMPSTSFTTYIWNDASRAEDVRSLKLKTGMGSGAQEIVPEEEGSSRITYQSLDAAWPTTAKTVLEEYDALRKGGLHEAQLIERKESGATHQIGIVYNVYLENSGNKNIDYQFSMSMPTYTRGKKSNSAQGEPSALYNYLRILICYQADAADNSGEEQHYWFAATSATENEHHDYKEAISSYTMPIVTRERKAKYFDDRASDLDALFARNRKQEQSSDGSTALENANDEALEPEAEEPLSEEEERRKQEWLYYANPFTYSADSTDSDQLLLLPNLTVDSKKTTRFSVVVYLEGNDPECKGQPPVGETFTLQAQINL